MRLVRMLFISLLALPALPAVAQAPSVKNPVLHRKAAKNLGRVQRLQQLTPEQRERLLSNLPAGRREQVERRLENWDRMPSDEQQRLSRQLENFRELPPERQQALRKIARRFQEIPEERRIVLRGELQALRGLNDDERQVRIDSDEFRNKYSTNEQQLLADLSRVLGPESK